MRPVGRSRSRRAPRSGNVLTDRLAVGERPQAPWHPLPLSELLILVGAVGTVVGLSRGESGIPVLFAGLVAVLIGTVEVTLREHLQRLSLAHRDPHADTDDRALHAAGLLLVTAGAGGEPRAACARRGARRAPVQTAACSLPGRAPRADVRRRVARPRPSVGLRRLHGRRVERGQRGQRALAGIARLAADLAAEAEPFQTRDLAFAFDARRMLGRRARRSGSRCGRAAEARSGALRRPSAAHVLDGHLVCARLRAGVDPRLGSSASRAESVYSGGELDDSSSDGDAAAGAISSIESSSAWVSARDRPLIADQPSVIVRTVDRLVLRRAL